MASNTPPCTALKRDGTPCGKSVGTIPTADGPRCFTHLKREQRLADPGSRPPVRNPKSAADVLRLASWAMTRVAQGRLSAPQAQAISSMSRVALRAMDLAASDQVEIRVMNAVQSLIEALGHEDRVSAPIRAALDALIQAFSRYKATNPKHGDEPI